MINHSTGVYDSSFKNKWLARTKVTGAFKVLQAWKFWLFNSHASNVKLTAKFKEQLWKPYWSKISCEDGKPQQSTVWFRCGRAESSCFRPDEGVGAAVVKTPGSQRKCQDCRFHFKNMFLRPWACTTGKRKGWGEVLSVFPTRTRISAPALTALLNSMVFLAQLSAQPASHAPYTRRLHLYTVAVSTEREVRSQPVCFWQNPPLWLTCQQQ